MNEKYSPLAETHFSVCLMKHMALELSALLWHPYQHMTLNREKQMHFSSFQKIIYHAQMQMIPTVPKSLQRNLPFHRGLYSVPGCSRRSGTNRHLLGLKIPPITGKFAISLAFALPAAGMYSPRAGSVLIKRLYLGSSSLVP